MTVSTNTQLSSVRATDRWLTLGEVIGRGDGCCVFAAIDEATREPVAVKVLAGERLRDDSGRQRMRTEAHIVTTCRHPNIIRGLSFHELDDMLILVMERFGRQTVFERSARMALSLAEILAILSATARALHYLHEQGFLHGDVKPENILFDPDGCHRLIDFGLARQWPFPVRQQVSGTPWYMAPETIRAGGTLVPATDVYALGMMGYELLAGHLPFPPADGPIGVMRQQLEHAPLPLGIAAPHLPAPLTALVMSAIEKDISRRIASAKEFADRLEV